MSKYKELNIKQSGIFFDENENKDNTNIQSNSFNEEEIQQKIEEIQNLLLSLLVEPMKNIPTILEKLIFFISHDSDILIHFINPEHLEKAIVLIRHKEVCELSLQFILYASQFFANTSQFFILSKDLFNFMGPLFHNGDNNIIDLCTQITIKSIVNISLRDIFCKCESMKNIRKNILEFSEKYEDDTDNIFELQNNSQIQKWLLVLNHLVNFDPYPSNFSEFVLPLMNISVFQNDLSAAIALDTLVKFVRNGIDIRKDILSYSGTSYIEYLTAFIQQNQKELYAIRLLSDISIYGNDIYKDIQYFHTIFEIKNAITKCIESNDIPVLSKGEIINELLSFFSKWYINSDCLRGSLFDYICSIDFGKLSDNLSYQSKLSVMNLLLNLVMDANTIQIMKFMRESFFNIIVEFIDEDYPEICTMAINSIITIINKCAHEVDFIRMIKNCLYEIKYQETFYQQQFESIICMINQIIPND